MPTVAVFDGVEIKFYAAGHPPPHFHAVHAGHRVQISIDLLRVMNGDLPSAKLSAVLSWARPRQAALLAAWDALQARRRPERIE